jgi:nucleoside-diphosphate-sugar epimerase
MPGSPAPSDRNSAAGPTPDWTLNDRIRRQGTANLMAACQSARVQRYVQQSIAWLVADRTTSVLDETAPVRPTAVTASAADMEAMCRGPTWTGSS